MTKAIHAVFDGKVLRLDKPIDLEPNTHVRVTIETINTPKSKTRSFLQTARSLNLQGPSDWSARFEEYLYGR